MNKIYRYIILILSLPFTLSIPCQSDGFNQTLVPASFFNQALYQVDQSFKPQVADFVVDAWQRGYVLPMEQYKVIAVPNTFFLATNFVGFCDFFDKTVYIDLDYWKTQNSSQQQQMIDHELGHCLLGRNHMHVIINYENNSSSVDFIPKSLMNPVVLSDNEYIDHKSYYRKELFQPQLFNKIQSELLGSYEANHKTITTSIKH
jgi:hypothetical protein